MKIFFERASRLPSPTLSGFDKVWSEFVGEISEFPQDIEVTYIRQDADVVINISPEQLTWKAFFSLPKRLERNELIWDWADRPTGRYPGLYSSLPRCLFDRKRHRSTFYPLDFNERIDFFPLESAIFNFGFVGGRSASVRDRIFELLAPTATKSNSYFHLQSADWARRFSRDSRPDPLKDDYANFLRRTKFVLCPRGYGVGSIRLFEVMKSGRVPIIISDNYVLPEGPDWQRFSIIVRENDIGRIPSIVQDHLPRWEKMARIARSEWERYFSPHAALQNLCTSAVQIIEGGCERSFSDRIRTFFNVRYVILGEYLRPYLGMILRILKIR